MTSAHLFISHASEDAGTAGPIVQYLEAQGVTCWISSRDIPPRSIYAEAITSAMRSADACVVIVSRSANESDAIKRELELASHYRKPFVPIRVDETEPGPGLDYYLRNTQWIDYHAERERGLDRIISNVKDPSAARQATHASAPGRRNNPLPALLAAALALVVIAGGAWYFYGPRQQPQMQNQATQDADTSVTPSESHTTTPSVKVDGVWTLLVACQNGGTMEETNARFSGGEYYRRFANNSVSGETRITLSSEDANSIRVTGQVSFDGGEPHQVDARATGSGASFSGTGSYGSSTNCPFTATRLRD